MAKVRTDKEGSAVAVVKVRKKEKEGIPSVSHVGHKPDCASGNYGPEWSGSARGDDSGWDCDECGGFIPCKKEE